MSRCFPFPPPGYERKHRPEDLDLMKEAKCKEKKHRNEEKERGRNKDKEKEKYGSAEKNRDKKDRKGKKRKDKKEMRRDKKDKEDLGKDKEKSSISEESAVAQNEEINEAKLYPVRNSNDRTNFLSESECSALLQDQNGGKPSKSSLFSQGNEESRFVHELDRRIRDEKSRGSQLPERVAVMDKKDRGIAVRTAVRNSSGILIEQKGENKNKRVDKKDPQDLKTEFCALKPIVKSEGEGFPRPVNEENGWRLEDKEKYKEPVGIKQKDRKGCHGEEKKRDDKAKLKSENKKSEQDKLNDDGRKNLGGFAGSGSTDSLKGASINAVSDRNIKKRKHKGTNGFLHVGEIIPNKMQRPAPHHSTGNGQKIELFRTHAKSSHDKHAAVPNNFRVRNKEQLLNGIFEPQKPFPSKQNNPPAATMILGQIAEASNLAQCDSNDFKKAVTVSKIEVTIDEASRRPLHPDSKYLAEVLVVPRNIADWLENDDQNWLFSEEVVPSEPKLFGDVRVWSEAVHVESADLCALPYVIPY